MRFVEHGDFVILPGKPRGILNVRLPMHSVGRTPNVVVEVPRRRIRRVISAAPQDPNAAVKNDAAANHAARRPIRFYWLHFLPVDAVGSCPNVSIEGFFGWREGRHCLAAEYPDLILEDKR